MKNPAPDGSPYRDIVVDDGPKAAIALRDMLRDEIACTFRDDPQPPPRNGVVAAGRYLCKTLRSGLQCLDCDLELVATLDMVSVSPRCIRVSALFEGASSWEVAGQQHVHPGQGIAQISALGQDTPIGFCEPMGQRYRMAGLLITPGFFDQGPEDLQDGLKELRALLDPGVRHCALPGAPALREILARLHAVPFQGALADLYRESLALGLVVELTRHLGDRAPGPAALPRRSAQLAAEAKARIDAAPEAVPSALRLAHDLGTNETTLRRAFKSAHGVRLFDYVLERRLQMGRDLLRDTALPIGDIAWRCGYGDPANFTHAYRRRFGCPPRAERG